MKTFAVHPQIWECDTVDMFLEEIKIGRGDLLIISQSTYDRYFAGKTGAAFVVPYRKFGGSGEPTDVVVESICEYIRDVSYDRVIAVGGGTILDVAKLFALEKIIPVADLYEKKFPPKRTKGLVLVPTTCGTGSEVTNISILELTVRNTKMGLAVDELYADTAVLIPQLLEELPFKFFATSSIDALIHSIESFTSPKANDFTKIFSMKAMTMILEGYKAIAAEGEAALKPRLKDFLLASAYAGIAFGNAGCAAVHAMSYPLGAMFHVPHGEANYAMFTGVYRMYMSIDASGSINELNNVLAGILDCGSEEVYDKIEMLLNHLIVKRRLSAYGVTQEHLKAYTETVMTKQGRLMANNYVPLSAEQVMAIYQKLY